MAAGRLRVSFKAIQCGFSNKCRRKLIEIFSDSNGNSTKAGPPRKSTLVPAPRAPSRNSLVFSPTASTTRCAGGGEGLRFGAFPSKSHSVHSGPRTYIDHLVYG